MPLDCQQEHCVMFEKVSKQIFNTQMVPKMESKFRKDPFLKEIIFLTFFLLNNQFSALSLQQPVFLGL